MNVLVVGGSGLVGENILKVFEKQPFVTKLLGTYLSYKTQNTVYCNPNEELPLSVANQKWDVIIHTGALTHVDLCEEQADLSYQMTVKSTANLLSFASIISSMFVYISTDYVFDGKKGPYVEADEVNPLNTYGRHKLEAEQLVLQYINSLVVRVTNVYGDEQRKKNFVSRSIENIKKDGMMSALAPFDQYATPINASDIASALLLLILDKKTGIYHLGSTDYFSRVQILQKINRYVGDKISINAVSTAQLAQKALRPLNGGLLSHKFLSEYSNFRFSNVDDYLKKAL